MTETITLDAYRIDGRPILKHSVMCDNCHATLYAIRHGWWGTEPSQADLEALGGVVEAHEKEYPHQTKVFINE